MTLEEAKNFYKSCDGIGFQMMRESPAYYDAYTRMNISLEMTAQWDIELINDAFSELWTNPERTWSRHELILNMIPKVKDQDGFLRRLLNEMEKMDALDKRTRVLIIENMAGRNQDRKDGGCYLYCRNGKYIGQMHRIMLRIMDFTCTEEDNTNHLGWKDMKGRYIHARDAYMDAYHRFNSAGESPRRCRRG